MPTKGFITVRDYAKDTATMYFHLPEITALNYAAVTQDLDEVRDAIEPHLLGKIVNVGFTRTFNDDAIDITPITDKEADRGKKFLVTLQDMKGWLDALGTIRNPGYGAMFSVEIPVINPAIVTNESDFVDIVTAGDGKDLADALAANIKSRDNRDASGATPNDTTFCRVVSIKRVSRTL